MKRALFLSLSFVLCVPWLGCGDGEPTEPVDPPEREDASESEAEPVEADSAEAEASEPPALLSSANQVLLVTSDSWDAPRGELQRFTRRDGVLEPVGAAIQVILGRSGLGWGIGLHAPAGEAGEPHKREGDGRSPAGVFALTSAFGYASAPPAGVQSEWIPVSKRWFCVDDVASDYYNQVLEWPASRGAKPWNSAETMRRRDDQYRLGMLVDHNGIDRPRTEGTPAGHGSCIFLHLWRSSSGTTAGCTAMDDASMVDLLTWVDPAQTPVLVQLPRDVMPRFRKAWGLPP